ncbi:hypothetical protein O0L34_g6641 [Tuta absoluta]|nr:hypothetical protein O0L34_g6641 [Tuta absoluta]
MQDKQVKFDWLAAARNKKIFAKDVILDLDETVANDQIYVREAATPNQKKLLWQVKQSLKPTYKFIWFKDGRILVRKEENSKIFCIYTEGDITKLMVANS